MVEEFLCEVEGADKDKVDKIKKLAKSEAVMMRMAETFKALGDKTRCKIIYALLKEESCVCEIAEALGVTKFVVSQHLRILRNLKLVKFRKVGKRVFYTLDDEHISNLIEEGIRHVEEDF
jgi:DNA-binding transcriptional ArsR family regulator